MSEDGPRTGSVTTTLVKFIFFFFISFQLQLPTNIYIYDKSFKLNYLIDWASTTKNFENFSVILYGLKPV